MGNGMKQREDPQLTRMLRLRRRKRHRMVFRVLCCVLVCLAAVFATTIFFRVSSIEVTGETRYDAEELIGTTGVEAGDNLFFLHTNTIVQALTNTYPYLDTITIKRHLPGTMEIAVTEREPLMCVELEDETRYYVDKQGKVLEKVSGTPNSNVIAVTGTGAKTLEIGELLDEQDQSSKKKPVGDNEKICAVLDILKLFETYEMLDQVRSVDITKSFDVKLNYNDSYRIEFGTLDDLEHKIQFLKAILKRNDLPATGIIDLSQGDKAHYRPAENETEEESTGEKAADTEQEEQTKEEDAPDSESTDTKEENTDDQSAERASSDPEEQEETGEEESASQNEE